MLVVTIWWLLRVREYFCSKKRGGGGEKERKEKEELRYYRKIQTNLLANPIDLVRLAIQVIMRYSHSVDEEKVVIAVS